jgi:hypothetical protein
VVFSLIDFITLVLAGITALARFGFVARSAESPPGAVRIHRAGAPARFGFIALARVVFSLIDFITLVLAGITALARWRGSDSSRWRGSDSPHWRGSDSPR